MTRKQDEPMVVMNMTRRSVVCEHALIAERAPARMRGLLGRRSLPHGEGLLLRPAPSIHTAFMRFSIDAVFLDSNLCVVKVVNGMRPWRMASARRATAVLELAAGQAALRGLGSTDQLALMTALPQDRP